MHWSAEPLRHTDHLSGHDQRAKATVGAIIDSMGSLGAAVGPLLSGWLSDEFVSFSEVKIYNLQR